MGPKSTGLVSLYEGEDTDPEREDCVVTQSEDNLLQTKERGPGETDLADT